MGVMIRSSSGSESLPHGIVAQRGVELVQSSAQLAAVGERVAGGARVGERSGVGLGGHDGARAVPSVTA